MKRSIAILTTSLVMLLTLGGGHPAAAGKLGVIGIATIDGIGSVPVLSFSSGVHQPGATGSLPVPGSRPEFTGLTLMKPLDQSSPKLFIAAASGQHIASARLDLYGTGSTVIGSIILTDVLITSVNQGGSSAADATAEEVTLAFGKLELQYNGANGTTSGAWDITQNKRV